jgi:CheY-like chemotaxis protein
MSKAIEVSDEQYAVLVDVAARRGETPNQIIAEVLAEIARERRDVTPETAAAAAVRQTLLRVRGQHPPILLDVMLPSVEPSQLIRALAQSLGMAEAELAAKSSVVRGEAYEMEDWFRHLGMTEEEIAHSAQLADELFPPDEPTVDSAPTVEHADSR